MARVVGFLALALTAACIAVTTAAADPIADKQAEAQRIIEQINALGVKLDAASEAYDERCTFSQPPLVQIGELWV